MEKIGMFSLVLDRGRKGTSSAQDHRDARWVDLSGAWACGYGRIMRMCVYGWVGGGGGAAAEVTGARRRRLQKGIRSK